MIFNAELQEQLSGDLNQLVAFNPSQLIALSKIVIQFVINPQTYDFQGNLSEFASANSRY